TLSPRPSLRALARRPGVPLRLRARRVDERTVRRKQQLARPDLDAAELSADREPAALSLLSRRRVHGRDADRLGPLPHAVGVLARAGAPAPLDLPRRRRRTPAVQRREPHLHGTALARSDPVQRILPRRHRRGARRVAPDRLDRARRKDRRPARRVRRPAPSACGGRFRGNGTNVSRYDLAVIGSGQGGVPLAIDFAARGKRVVLFERGNLGGCCVNVGCTPSKAFLASAHAAGRARRASDVHVHCDVAPDVPAVMERVRAIVGEWRAGVEKKLAESSVELVRAEAAFAAPQTLRANGTLYEADAVVIDTGGTPAVPPLDGLAGTPFLTSDTFFGLETLPERLLVLGGGYVGLELGQGAARLGSHVTVITPEPRLVTREDADVADVLMQSFARDGMTIVLERSASLVAYDGATFRITLDDGTALAGDALLVATGRRPVVPPGAVEHAGIALDERGYVRCDDHLRASVPGHYALGDVAGQPQFTHVSWEDFRRLRAI